MRFTDALIFLGLLCFLSVSISGGYRNLQGLEEKTSVMEMKVESTRFISESFRNTCSNAGFENLVEWQKVCRAMWKLDYIAWGKAESFMETSESDKGELFYGTWTGPCGRGEVYCRKLKS